MEYKIDYDSEEAICTFNVSGRVRRPNDSIILMQEVLKYSSRHHCRLFLLDFRYAIVHSSLQDAQKLADFVTRSDYGTGYKVALLYSGDMTEHRQLEAILINKGLMVHVFDDKIEALSWLSQGQSDD
jgi:hypothetical protein